MEQRLAAPSPRSPAALIRGAQDRAGLGLLGGPWGILRGVSRPWVSPIAVVPTPETKVPRG